MYFDLLSSDPYSYVCREFSASFSLPIPCVRDLLAAFCSPLMWSISLDMVTDSQPSVHEEGYPGF